MPDTAVAEPIEQTAPAPETPAETSGVDIFDDYIAGGQSNDEPRQQENDRETPEREDGEEVADDQPGHSFKGIKPEVVALMKHFAATDKDYDLNDPKDFKSIRRFAEQEVHARGLKAGQPPSEEAKSYLDLFSDPEPEKKAADAPKANQVTDGEEDLPNYAKVARKWQKPADVSKSLAEAFDMDDGPAKDDAIADVLMGLDERNFMEIHLPRVEQLVNHLIESRLGPVLESSNEEREYAMRREVVGRLAGMDEYKDIHDLFEKASNDTISVNGEEVEDTWINRVIKQFPGVLKIREDGKSPAERQRKTLGSRYTEAHRLMKVLRGQEIDPKKAAGLVQTGRTIEKSKQADSVRHGLNAGRTGSPNGGRKDDGFGSDFGKPSPMDLLSGSKR